MTGGCGLGRRAGWDRVGPRRRPTPSRPPASGARSGRSTPSARRAGCSTTTRPAAGRGGHLVRLERLPRASAPIRRWPRPRWRPSSGGAPARARPGWWSGRGPSTTISRTALAAWRGSRVGAGAAHRLRRQPGRALHLRRDRACASCPTSSTTPRSSTAAAWPGPRWPSTATPTPTTWPPSCDRARADGVGPLPRGDRHRVLDGRRRGAGGRHRRAAAGPIAPCSCSTRPTPCSARPRRRRARRGRGAAGRHPVEDPRLARRLRGRQPPPRRPAGEPGPALHLHHRVRRPPTGRGRAAALGHRAAEPRATRSRPACAGHVERLRPATPRPSCPVLVGDERDAVAAGRRAAGARASWCRPSARPPCPPGTSRLRVALSAAHTDDQIETLAATL